MLGRPTGLAMGGSVDFENVFGTTGDPRAAIGMYASPVRLAHGGQANQDDLMKRVGDLLHRVHRVWHEHMMRGGAIGYASGGRAQLHPKHSRLGAGLAGESADEMLERYARDFREENEGRILDRVNSDPIGDVVSGLTGNSPGDAGYWMGRPRAGGMIPSPLGAAIVGGLYSGDAGAAQDELREPTMSERVLDKAGQPNITKMIGRVPFQSFSF